MAYTLLATLILVALSRSSAVPKPASLDLFAPLPDFKHKEELLEHYGDFMLSTMNRSVDPCENFYEYACGSWKESKMLTEKARNTSVLGVIQERINDQILAFLQNATQEQLQDKNHSTSAEWKAKQFFASCVQMKVNLSLGYEKIMGQQDDRYAVEWKQHYQNASRDWIYLNFMSHYDVYPLLPMRLHYNTSGRKFDILLSGPSKALANVNEEQLQNMTRDFGIIDEQKRKDFLSNFANLTQFERNLTQLVKHRNDTEQLKLGEFITRHKEDRLNWTRYFDVAFNGTQRSSWPVINLLEDVGELVHFLERTELSVLRSYVQHRVLIKFYEVWKTKTRNGTLASECRVITETYFNYALLPWFIEENFDKERRADVLTLAKHIKDTFYDLLDQYSWLDDETRSEAKTKLSSMDILVGYSDDLQHREIFDAVYSNQNMTSDWYENLVTLEKNRAKVKLRSVDKALIPQVQMTRIANAYYAGYFNQAFIAIGISQWPLYHVDFPAVLKFAGIGNIVGHEMAHGFDSTLYQYNYDGKKVNWWSAASLRNFKERYRCLESQYNKYILLGVQTNGTLTSGDNIADNVGARMAYRAYERNMGSKAWQKKPLQGIDYNNKQLFFLKFAQSWCTGADNASKLSKIKSDEHAYEEFRVIGTLSNMPEFSEAFNCKLGTDMNPLKKCVVW
ncbi:neprilysin [Drosophila sulfurigaster albostrigata]|uniref:neprilysin n=1 Tax=Drosophila sulfurigaster albostrigata TaxID=89887 RepID=UPI002D21C186|nr:neprilysin [Drosophila sulfurigaster albostrigata]